MKKDNERKSFSENKDGRIDFGKFSENQKKAKKPNAFKLLFRKNKAFDLSSDSDEKPTVDAEAKKVSEKFNTAYNILWLVVIAFVVFFFVFFGDGITTGSMQHMFRDMFGHGDALGSVTKYYFSVNDNAVFGDFSGVPVVAGSDRVVIFAPDGSHQYSNESDYALPEIKTSEKYILIYDQNGTAFGIYDAFGERYSEPDGGRIYCGDVSDAGVCVVARRGKEYNSEIGIYSAVFTPRYIKKNNRVASLDIKNDGSEVMILSYSVSADGKVESELMLLEATANTPRVLFTLNEGMPLECKYLENGGIAVLFDDMLCILDDNGNKTASCAVNIKEAYRYALADDGALVCCTRGREDSDVFSTELTRLTQSGVKKSRYTVNGRVVDLNMYGDYAYIITEHFAVRLNASDLSDAKIYQTDEKIYSLAIISGDEYICFADSIEKIDFEK